MNRFLLFISVFLMLVTGLSRAQMMGGQMGPDSLSNTVLPFASYNSIEGFIGGVIYNRYNYQGNTKPFKNYLESSALVSTKGFVEVGITYEKTNSWGGNIRSIYDAFVHRYTRDIFFGIGNGTSFSDNRWDNEYYYFESISFGLNYTARYPIYADSGSQLDIMGGLGSEYNVPYVRMDNSSFAMRAPNGAKGGWINYLNAGLIWENRDSEFNPHRGNRAQLEMRFSPKLTSSYGLTTARLELRQYFYLFNWLTVANRLEARHVTGDVPYWELSTLGGESNLRGYPLNRFQGNTSLAYTMELRGWFLKFPRAYNLKFGGLLFTDTGRVFTGSDDIHDLFQGYKQTVGFGGTMSILNPDFIVRGEIGFSEDVSRIYIGIGYLF